MKAMGNRNWRWWQGRCQAIFEILSQKKSRKSLFIQLSEVDLIKTKTIKTLSLISIFSRFAYSADAA